MSFSKNGDDLKQGFSEMNFKQGGYVPVVAALLEGSKFSLTLPNR